MVIIASHSEGIKTDHVFQDYQMRGEFWNSKCLSFLAILFIAGIGVDFSPVFTMFKGKPGKESKNSLKMLSRKEREAIEQKCEFTLKQEKSERGTCTFFHACKVCIVNIC